MILIKYEYLYDETNYFGVTKQFERRLQLTCIQICVKPSHWKIITCICGQEEKFDVVHMGKSKKLVSVCAILNCS